MNIQNHPERRAKWQVHVEEQEKSGLSQKEFCKTHDLVLSKFVYYRSILKIKKAEEAVTTTMFAPVQVKTKDRVASVEIKIILPNGFQCFVPSLIEASHLKNMMEVLLSC